MEHGLNVRSMIMPVVVCWIVAEKNVLSPATKPYNTLRYFNPEHMQFISYVAYPLGAIAERMAAILEAPHDA